MTGKHRLLERQIRKSSSSEGELDFDTLCALISSAYVESEQEQRRTDRSISLMVEELDSINTRLEVEIADRTCELRETRARLMQTLASVDQGIVMIDAAGRIVVYNEAFLAFTGLTDGDCANLSDFSGAVRKMRAAGEFDAMSPAFLAWVDQGANATSEAFTRVRPDGTVLQVRCRTLVGGGEVRTLTDVTALARQTETAEAIRHSLRVTLDNLSQGVIKVDASHRVDFFNPRVEELLSLPTGFLRRGMPFKEILDWQIAVGEFSNASPSFVDFVKSGGILATGQVYVRERPNGVILETRTVPLGDGAAVRTYTDITESRRRELQLTRIAHFDGLTGLANRALLNERLAHELAAPGVAGGTAVLCIDLDRFKLVNDARGHEAGDVLLQQAAERLLRMTPSDGLAARFGGDEFVVLLSDITNADEAATIACAIVKAFTEPFHVSGRNHWIGASVGVAMADCGDTPQDVLRKADVALYKAKAAGRGTFCRFHPSMEQDRVQREEIEPELRRALRDGEFRVFYQPIVDLLTSRPVAYEALVRWHHPQRGLLPPSMFIEAAEDCGLIGAIGEHVLNEACRAFAALDPALAVSVNLSPVQFQNHALGMTVLNALLTSGLNPERLILEITERLLLTEDDRTLEILEQLRAMGVRIALDDFGIGNSSFAYLQKFRFDKVKIDRSFMSDTGEVGMGAAIRRSLIGLGRDVGIDFIIEGIETTAQHQRVLAEGARYGQGYLFGRPDHISAVSPTGVLDAA
jgi:diguanylate cyclase (GGDEF)-like protein